MSTNTYKGCLEINMAAGCVSGPRVFTLCMNCMKAPREPAASMRLFSVCFFVTEQSGVRDAQLPAPPTPAFSMIPSLLRHYNPWLTCPSQSARFLFQLVPNSAARLSGPSVKTPDVGWKLAGGSLACGPRLFWSLFGPQRDSVRATVSSALIGGDAHPSSLVLQLN